MSNFIEVVPYYNTSYNLLLTEDYMAIAPNVMKDRGFSCEYVILKPKKTTIDIIKIKKRLYKGISIKVFNSYIKYFVYLFRKKKSLIFFNDRILSSLLGFIFGKRSIFMSHQSSLPNTWLKRQIFSFCIKRFDKIRVVNPYEFNELMKVGVKKKK